MKIAVFVMAIMVTCICPGRISEEKDLVLGEQRRPKDCRSPKGKHGNVRNDGCIQSTCTNGKWKPKMRTDICCYKQKVHKPKTVLDKLVSADKCSSTTIGCGALAQLEFHHESCTDPATKQQVEKLEQQIKDVTESSDKQIRTLENKLDHLTQMVTDNFELMLSDEKNVRCDTNTSATTTIPTRSREISGPGCECTTTTAAAPTTTNPMAEGVLITGGSGAETSTELFLPHTGKTCSPLSLPDNRYLHSLDVVSNKIILCGGEVKSGEYTSYGETSCLEFHPTSSTGSWSYYATLDLGRYGHSTHSFQEDLLLMGGEPYDSQGTTEIIGNGTQFDLQQSTSYACSIPDQASTILTGGWNHDIYNEFTGNIGDGYLKTVVRYNMEGFVENLPDLGQARKHHGCGYYINQGNNKVMVVAGGQGNTEAYLSSTELLKSGAKSWTSGKPLPRTIAYLTTANMGSYILIIGGYAGDKSFKKVLKFNGTWTEVGMMKNARHGAAAARININHLNITDCN